MSLKLRAQTVNDRNSTLLNKSMRRTNTSKRDTNEETT